MTDTQVNDITVERLLLHIQHRMMDDRYGEIMSEFGPDALDSEASMPQIVREDSGYGCEMDDIALMLEAGLMYVDHFDGHRVYRWSGE